MKIKGTVKSIVFNSTTSLFKVLNVITDSGQLTVTGELPYIEEEGYYEFEGQSKIHSKYGVQFEASNATSLKQTTSDGLIAYLSSSKFSGVGKKTATLIVDSLGLDAIDKIKSDESILESVSDISKKKAKDIREQIIKNSELETIFIKLYSYGLSKGAANKIYSKYLDETLKKVEENPYILIHDLDGFGFVKSDNLALRIGFKEDSSVRIKEAINYTLSLYCDNNGYTFLTLNQLTELASKLLNERSNSKQFNPDDLIIYVADLISDGTIIKSENRIYPKNLYNAEFNASALLNNLIQLNKKIDQKKIDYYIKESERMLSFSLTDEQKRAIKTSLSNKVSIITGGPGTGKTTILKCLLMCKALMLNLDMRSEAFQRHVLLLAPTGKASKRMMGQTEFNASTIHKALGYDETGHFLKNASDNLVEDFIIIDESSMIDIELFSHLLEAIRVDAQIIFVGDVNQLPSVGPGNVLNDMINSKVIKVSYLTQIMRQKGDSKIIELAHMINEKNIDFTIFNDKKELFFFNVDEQNILPLTLRIIEKYISNGYDLYNDMQILAPMYSSLNGIDALNKSIQQLFNKSNEYIKYGEKIFKVGDKVLQLQNNPNLGIMNGDTGVIKALTKDDEDEYLYIMFDKMVKYPKTNLDELTLGYAISIHKSQGSEFKNVIIPISAAFRIMMKKKLIYTAVTRAKEKIILIGNPNVLKQSLFREEDIRQTSLARMLNPAIFGNNVVQLNQGATNIIKIDDPISAFDYIGEENMDNITPYTFMKK